MTPESQRYIDSLDDPKIQLRHRITAMLLLYYPNQWGKHYDSWETLEMNEGYAKPSKEEFDEKLASPEVEAEFKRWMATQKRMVSYPQVTDQLDMLYHAIDADPTLQEKFGAFYQAINEVKTSYPKS